MKKETTITNFIFDVTGVLFTFNHWKILSLLGKRNLATYLLKHWQNPINRSFEISKLIAQREDNGVLPIIFYRGHPQPPQMTACLLGQISSQSAADTFKQQLLELQQEGHLSCDDEVAIIHRMIDIMFDPTTQLAVFKQNRSLINLVKKLKQQSGTTCYIISNLNTDTYAMLQQHYPKVFALFTDSVISSKVGFIKPYPSIYQHLLKSHNLTPESCLFVDDQSENIKGAEQLGIKGIVYTTTGSLKKQLAKLKLLA